MLILLIYAVLSFVCFGNQRSTSMSYLMMFDVYIFINSIFLWYNIIYYIYTQYFMVTLMICCFILVQGHGIGGRWEAQGHARHLGDRKQKTELGMGETLGKSMGKPMGKWWENTSNMENSGKIGEFLKIENGPSDIENDWPCSVSSGLSHVHKHSWGLAISKVINRLTCYKSSRNANVG